MSSACVLFFVAGIIMLVFGIAGRGIETKKKDDLIAANMSVEELKDYLGVDSLEFLSIDNLKVILGSSDHCFGCFTEKYPVNKPKETHLFD